MLHVVVFELVDGLAVLVHRSIQFHARTLFNLKSYFLWRKRRRIRRHGGRLLGRRDGHQIWNDGTGFGAVVGQNVVVLLRNAE